MHLACKNCDSGAIRALVENKVIMNPVDANKKVPC